MNQTIIYKKKRSYRKLLTASSYDFNPKPEIDPLQCGAIKDLCLNASLLKTLVMCTSITVVLTAVIASAMAIDVCVYAAAFNIIPS